MAGKKGMKKSEHAKALELQKRQHEHEARMEMLKVLQSSEGAGGEMKYFIGMLISAGVAGGGAILASYGITLKGSNLSPEEKEQVAALQAEYEAYMAAKPNLGFAKYINPFTFVAGTLTEQRTQLEMHKAFLESRQQEIDMLPKDENYAINKAVSEALMLGGVSLGGFCAMMLMLKAVFGGNDQGGGLMKALTGAIL